jgi:heme/copper-type cytochrome/quinol oxidase subunit 2
MPFPSTRRVVAGAAVLALVLAACSGGGGTSAPSGKPTRIDVTVRNGRVTAPSQPKVALGSEVEIHVSADVDEEVHVHGYDLKRDVSPAAPADIRFTPDVPGVFEVELEHSGQLLFRFEVGG